MYVYNKKINVPFPILQLLNGMKMRMNGTDKKVTSIHLAGEKRS